MTLIRWDNKSIILDFMYSNNMSFFVVLVLVVCVALIYPRSNLHDQLLLVTKFCLLLYSERISMNKNNILCSLTLTLPGPSAGASGSLDSYCSLKPLCSGMGEVVPARTSPTLLPHPLALCCHYPVSKCCSASIAVTGTVRVKKIHYINYIYMLCCQST